MNRSGQPIEKTSWWRIAILGTVILASWIGALVLLPRLGEGRPAPTTATPSQTTFPSWTAQATAMASATTASTPTTAMTPTVTTPTASPTATAQAEAVCLATADQLNVRSGPGTTYSVLMQLQASERVTPIARNSDGTWVQAIARDGVQGWISATYLNCQGVAIMSLPVVAVYSTPTNTIALPTATPAPQPTAPQSFRNWRGEYYGNTSLAGPLLLLRDDAQVSFDWGSGSPSPSVPIDNWSARWSRELNTGSGLIRFQVRVDDGVRLWVDGRLLIDQWKAANATYTAEVYLSGDRHNVVVEYVEYGGNALISLSWQRIEQTFNDWRGAYYDNANLAGNPVLVRDDKTINFDWRNGSPAQGIPADRFSVRWSQRIAFSEGRYRFRVEADDGVRLWVAGNLLIDRWQGGARVDTVDQRIWTGTHEVVLEYFELEGSAKAKLSWEKLSDARTPTSTTPTRTPVITEWRAEYYNNEKLEGTPRIVRNEREISFDWRNDAPVSGVGRDHFSARFTRQLTLPAGIYRWAAAADDGVRLYINEQLIIDAWQVGPLTEHVRQVPMAEGTHTIRIEYLESTGFAALYVHWERLAPTATTTQTMAPPPATETRVAATPTATATGIALTATATATEATPANTPTFTAEPATVTPTVALPTETSTLAPPTLTATSIPPTAPPTLTPTSIPPTATPTMPVGQSVPYRSLLQGNQSFKFVKQTAYKVFASRLAWDNWVEAQGGAPAPLPGVDWGNEAVVAVFLDPQLDISPDGSTVGVAISGIRSVGQSLAVEVSLRLVPPAGNRPGPGVRPKDGPAAPRPSPGTPYHIVAMTRTGVPGDARIPVNFVDVKGQLVGTDTLAPASDLQSGLEISPGIRRSKEP